MKRNEEPFEPGRTLGGWTILEPLGSGGAGRVYRVRRGDATIDHALKVLPGAPGLDRRRFENEVATLARLSHPSLVRFIEALEAGEHRCFVTELAPGEPLDRILQGPVLPLAGSHAILVQLASVLDHCHEHGILHRDLKPAHIVVSPAGDIKVVDLGLSRLVQEETLVTSPGQVRATLAYTAPEILLRRAVDHRADLYAVGVIAFELLTGAHPFPVRSPAEMALAHISRPPPDLRDRAPGLSPWWARILDRLLAKAPQERYAGAGSLERDLVTLRSELVGRGS